MNFWWALFQRIFGARKAIAKPVDVPPTVTINIPVPTPQENKVTLPKKTEKSLVGYVGVGAAGLLLVMVPKFEGMVLRGYKDPIGIVTACAGHTKTAVLGKAYTMEQCNKLLDQDLAEHAKGAMRCIKVPTTPGERAAYVSFAYNVGTGAFCKSTMVRKLNAGDYIGACNELGRWTQAGGKELKGLVRRRAAERALCVAPGSRSVP